VPEDAIPDGLEECAPDFFELQIKTLFQHAWSESSHDIAYKPPRPLTSLEHRNLALSAAQAWGADQIFDQLGKALTSKEADH
jgi:ppGpp synthetase/RelA/SpoT-type nucleotidyltranferase